MEDGINQNVSIKMSTNCRSLFMVPITSQPACPQMCSFVSNPLAKIRNGDFSTSFPYALEVSCPLKGSYQLPVETYGLSPTVLELLAQLAPKAFLLDNPSDPDTMTTTALEAIASSSGNDTTKPSPEYALALCLSSGLGVDMGIEQVHTAQGKLNCLHVKAMWSPLACWI